MESSRLSSLTAALATLGLVGCNHNSTVDDAVNQGKNVVREQTGNAADRLKKLEQDYRDGKIVDPKTVAKLNAELAAFDARKTYDEVKAKLEQRVKDAQQVKENAGKTADQIRAELKKADETYQNLSKRADDARRSYEDLAQRLSDVVPK